VTGAEVTENRQGTVTAGNSKPFSPSQVQRHIAYWRRTVCPPHAAARGRQPTFGTCWRDLPRC